MDKVTVNDLPVIFTVRCTEGHAVAQVAEHNERRLLLLRITVNELGPHSSVLSGDRTSWTVLGDLDVEADEQTGILAPCPCGSTSLDCAWILDQMLACTSRKRQVVHPVTYLASDDPRVAPTKLSTLGVSHLSDRQ